MSTATIQDGDIVQFTQDHRRASRGTLAIVVFHSPALKPGDDDYGNEDVEQGELLEVFVNGGYVDAVPVEMVRLATKAADVKEPTRRELAAAIVSGSSDIFSISESGPEDEGVQYIVFTDERTGKEWTAYVTVSDIEKSL